MFQEVNLFLVGTGNSCHFSNPVDIGMNFGNVGTTIEAWYTDNGSSTWSKLFTFGQAAAGRELAYTNRRGNGEFSGVDRNGTQTMGMDVTQNTEHHLVISVAPNGTLNTWLDGNQIHTDVPTNNLYNVSTVHESIGDSAWNDPTHNGTVNEFRIWKGNLSPEQVTANNTAGPDTIPVVTPTNTLTIVDCSFNSSTNEGSITVAGLEVGKDYRVEAGVNLIDFVGVPGGSFTATSTTQVLTTPHRSCHQSCSILPCRGRSGRLIRWNI